MSKGPLGNGRFPTNGSPQAQNQFVREKVRADLRSGAMPGINDRFGAPIAVGDLVVARPEPDPVWQIMDITPVMDPNAQPGTLRVTLQTMFPIQVQAGRVLHTMIRVGRAQDAVAPTEPPPAATASMAVHEGPVQDIIGKELAEVVESGDELKPDKPSLADA